MYTPLGGLGARNVRPLHNTRPYVCRHGPFYTARTRRDRFSVSHVVADAGGGLRPATRNLPTRRIRLVPPPPPRFLRIQPAFPLRLPPEWYRVLLGNRTVSIITVISMHTYDTSPRPLRS